MGPVAERKASRSAREAVRGMPSMITMLVGGGVGARGVAGCSREGCVILEAMVEGAAMGEGTADGTAGGGVGSAWTGDMVDWRWE